MAGLVLNVVRLAPQQPYLGETQPDGADENTAPTKSTASMTNRKRPAAAAATKTPGGTQRGSSGRRRTRLTKKVLTDSDMSSDEEAPPAKTNKADPKRTHGTTPGTPTPVARMDVDAAAVLATSESLGTYDMPPTPTAGGLAALADLEDPFQYLSDPPPPRLGALQDEGGLARDYHRGLLVTAAPTDQADGEVRELMQAVRQLTSTVQTMHDQQVQQGKLMEDLLSTLRATPGVLLAPTTPLAIVKQEQAAVDELTASINWGSIIAKAFAKFKFVADVPPAQFDAAAKPATITLHAVVEAGLDSVGITCVDTKRLEACATHLSTKILCQFRHDRAHWVQYVRPAMIASILHTHNPTLTVSDEAYALAAWGPGGKYAERGSEALAREGGLPVAWWAAKARRGALAQGGGSAGPTASDVAFTLLALQQLVEGKNLVRDKAEGSMRAALDAVRAWQQRGRPGVDKPLASAPATTAEAPAPKSACAGDPAAAAAAPGTVRTRSLNELLAGADE